MQTRRSRGVAEARFCDRRCPLHRQQLLNATARSRGPTPSFRPRRRRQRPSRAAPRV